MQEGRVSYHLQPLILVVMLLFFVLNCQIFRVEGLQAVRFLLQLVLLLMGCYGKSSALEIKMPLFVNLVKLAAVLVLDMEWRCQEFKTEKKGTNSNS